MEQPDIIKILHMVAACLQDSFSLAGIKKNPQFFADFTYRALQAAFSGKDRAACTFPVQGECFIRMPLRKKGIVPVCS